jgi:hypothetical protein
LPHITTGIAQHTLVRGMLRARQVEIDPTTLQMGQFAVAKRTALGTGDGITALDATSRRVLDRISLVRMRYHHDRGH